jgi:hypothetical protein
MSAKCTVLATTLGLALLSGATHAQWLNYPTPGTPRLPDGKPNLFAPTPHTAEGTPDLTGVWMHELTSVAEMKRLYGAIIDERVKVDVPGMEIGTQHKYSNNILLDFTPGESPLRPEATDVMRKRAADRDPANVCMGVPGFPRAGLLSEPIKIVQSPRTTVVLYEAGNLHRQIFTDGRGLPKGFEFPAFLGYSVDIGSATSLSWKPRASTIRPRWMGWATLIATPCASRNASAAATSDTWMLK